MDFGLTAEQSAIRDSIKRICDGFGDDYWREHDNSGAFPTEFHRAIAEGGWLGIAMPEEFGGAALGVTEAAIMMHAIAGSSGAMAAASSVHINIFGPHPIVVHGTREQKQRWLPPLIAGQARTCFGVTEPDAGLDTGRIKTRADRVQGGYVVHGQKIWTSTAQQADKILLLARTTPREQVQKRTDGLSVFLVDMRAVKDKGLTIRPIRTMMNHATTEVFIDNMTIPADSLVGEEGKGFRYILSGMNAERILIASECIGDAKWFIEKATAYAKERSVFGRPIGQNQGVQFPIARAYQQMRAAELMVHEAAALYEAGEDCGAEANMAKQLAAEASWAAADMCVQTHGGFGFAEEFDIERKFRETRLYQTAPISTNLILSYLAEHVLGLPRSY